MSRPEILLHSWLLSKPGPWRAGDADRSTSGATSVTVLVVDDDERVRRLTARMLRSRGYHALEAGSAAECLERLAGNPQVEVLLTDIVMPGTHGVALAETVRNHYPRCRVLLMTGYAPELLGRFGIERPPFPVLQKPFGAEELVRQIVGALDAEH